MDDLPTSQPKQPAEPFSLFDSYGLPWTAHLSLGWIVFLILFTGGLAAIPVGLCLGLWIRSKTRSVAVLVVYGLLAASTAVLFTVDPTWALSTGAGLLSMMLWYAGALIARSQITRYYVTIEQSEFHLSLPFTLLFGVWYVNYRIRAEFPHRTQSGADGGNIAR